MAGSRYVALLRGINVGGKNKLPMRDLVRLFEDVGCSDVGTYIQSGNVVFGASQAVAKRVPGAITQRIREELGYDVPVVTRPASELEAVVRGNPFLAEGADPATLHVAFLADAPAKAALAKLDPARSPPDRFVVKGRDIYLCLPKGVAKSKLTNAWFDSRLGTTSTLRNWRTVLKLAGMAEAR